LPEGSNWDGTSGLLVDEKTYNELLGDREKPAPPAAAPAPTPAPQAPAISQQTRASQ
jgi:hypothetical protein